MHRRVTALLVALGIALSGCAPHTSVTSSQDTADTTLTVLAASSTRVINDELTERAGQLESPVNLSFENGGSSDLCLLYTSPSPRD